MNFRFKALQAKREPDELDSPTLLAAPRGWIATFVVLITVLGALAWAVAGRLPVTVSAAGLLTHPAGTARLQSTYGGMVNRLLVHLGDQVRAGQQVAEVIDQTGARRQVASPFTGQVVGQAASDGQVIAPGTTLLTVERTDAANDRLVAMLFVPAPKAIGVRPGSHVDIAVSTAPPGAFGLLQGRVTEISEFPLTAEAVAGLVGGDLAARPYLTGPPSRLVLVDLTPDTATRSGYAWSTVTGPPAPLHSQVSVNATVTLGNKTPLSLIFGR
jgi:multidrug efflux pump subunit AcrA (membrane-fusion protein)